VEADSGNGYAPGWGMRLMMMTTRFQIKMSFWLTSSTLLPVPFSFSPLAFFPFPLPFFGGCVITQVNIR